MADNFDMKKFLVENQTGPYAKAKLTEGEAAYEYEKGKAAGEKEEKAKLTKEGDDEDKLPLTPKMKKFIDKSISDAKKDGDFEELVQVDYFENDFIEYILGEFDHEAEYDDVSQEVKDYINRSVKDYYRNPDGTPYFSEDLNEDSDENYDIFMDGVLDVLVKDKLITKADVDALNRGGADDLMDALHDEWEGFKNYEETGQAISRSDLNLAARAVAKKIGKLKEDLGKDRTDAEAEKMMDFLAEKDKVEEGLSDIKNFFLKVADNIKKGLGSECVAEYNMAIKAGKSDREAIAIYDACLSGEKGGFQGPSITKATYGIAEKKVEEAIAPDAIERMEGLANIQDLAALKTKLMILASDWNQEGFEKEDVLEYIKHLLDNQFNEAKKPMKEGEDIFADIEDDLMHGSDSKRDQIEYLQEVIDWCQNKIEEIKDTNMDEAMGGKNPEGDALVLRFLKGVAKKFDYPVAKAAIFVKDTIKSLGY